VILTVTTSAMNRYIIMKIMIILDGKVKNLFMVEIILMLLFMTVISLFFICIFIINIFNVSIVSGINTDIIIALLLILNFSFDAILVIYMNRINIPPTIIKNRMYENHIFWFMFPVIIEIMIVCINRINPIDRGWFIIKNVIVKYKFTDMIVVIISRSSLIKILILEINDKFIYFFLMFSKTGLFLVYKTNIFIKLRKLMLIHEFYGFLMFYRGLLVFSLKRKHLLLMLLRLEFVVLSIYYILFIYLSCLGRDYFFSIIFLTFRVCEGVLGLSILVSLIRTHGNDYFQSFSLL
jgi:NADH-ubiquinone oxidoreductase chain 4L